MFYKNKTVNAVKKNNDTFRVIYDATKLGSKFPIKDKTKPEHMHNIVYHAKCPEDDCNANYIGQMKCRLQKRIIQHNKTDKTSHIHIHSNSNNHRRVWTDDFKVIGRGYKSNFKRRISEALFVKEEHPDLNVQKDAYRLSLYG